MDNQCAFFPEHFFRMFHIDRVGPAIFYVNLVECAALMKGRYFSSWLSIFIFWLVLWLFHSPTNLFSANIYNHVIMF